MTRLPSTSRPFRPYIASSASQGSLNSWDQQPWKGRTKRRSYLQNMHNLARSDMNEPHYVIKNIWEKRERIEQSLEVHTTKAKSRFISTSRTLRKRVPETVRPSRHKYRRVDTSPLTDELNTTLSLLPFP